MIPRRQLLGAGMLGGVLGLADAGEPEASQAGVQGRSERELQEIVGALGALRMEVRNQRAFVEITAVREAQKAFIRQNGKWPDFIDVGVDAWFNVYDWHIRWQQPLTLGRDPNGRHTILLMETTVVMRPETLGNFMSLPYDKM